MTNLTPADDPHSQGDPNDRSVAIIGAGIAGLTAAVELARLGVAVAVFDKARGVSGRMSTRWAEERRFDHGAQYFTVRDEQFASFVERWVSEGVVAEWDAPIVSIRCGATGPELADPPPATQRYVGVPGMNAVGKALAAEATALGAVVTTGVRVTPPKPAGGSLRLTAEGGEALGAFDRVLVATPAPQAAELLVGSPALANAAKSAPMTGCWTAMVAFDDPVEPGFDAAFIDGDASATPLSWIARNGSKPERPTLALAGDCWVLHGSPEWSEANLELDPADAADTLLAGFFSAVGTVPVPVTSVVGHRWRYALPESPLAERAPADPSRGLYAAGDWCGGPRVEGAFLSGFAAAEAIASAWAGV